jgi:hypothetical protein
MTATLYAVDEGTDPVSVGEVIGSATRTVGVRYRPSADPTRCPASPDSWYSESDDRCFTGFAQTIEFPASDFSGIGPLPEKLIWTIAFNTTHAGYDPIGEGAACYGTSAGCPYDALNVGATSFGSDIDAFEGTDEEPASAFYNSSNGWAYCDGGAAGVDVLRDDVGCWLGYRPVGRINVPPPAPPESATVLSAQPTNPDVGDPVTLTAEVRCSPAVTPVGGTVTFREGGTDLGTTDVDPSGQATLPLADLSAGEHTFTAHYNGDGCSASDSNPVTVVVRTPPPPASTTNLTVQPHKAKVGRPIILTATVACGGDTTPTGTVTFYSGDVELGTSDVDGAGRARLEVDDLPRGRHTLTAHYDGDGCAPSVSEPVTVVVKHKHKPHPKPTDVPAGLSSLAGSGPAAGAAPTATSPAVPTMFGFGIIASAGAAGLLGLVAIAYRRRQRA